MEDTPMEVINVVSDSGTNTQSQPKKTLKRKRKSSASSVVLHNLTSEEKAAQIGALEKELEGLFGYYRELVDQKVGFGFGSDLGGNECSSLNGKVGLLMEESPMALSKLVAKIHSRLSEEAEENENVTLAMVKAAVLFVGQRVLYGVPNVHADILEDETRACLWCWETRDLKLMPKCLRGALKIRRTCRKKIHERVTAVSEVIAALQNPESDQSKVDVMKASEKLRKALGEAEIRSLVDTMTQKNGAEMADKEAQREQKLLIKQLEKNKRQFEKEKKMIDLEHQKEKKQSEKDQKRLQEEAEKEKRREKEEAEMRKQLRKQQEEVEKEQRRREKEETELKKQMAIKKQAQIMERFLKRSKSTSPCQDVDTSAKASPSMSSSNNELHEAVTKAMDNTLSSNEDMSIDNIRKLHLSSWNHLGRTLRSNGKQHWSIRQKPKAELFKELKLSSNRELAHGDELNVEKFVRGWGEQSSDDGPCVANSKSPDNRKGKRKQLLQFDKSNRPAFYGIWHKQSHIIGPRHPLRKDPDLDYDVDSDEEWQEEEPGESLSDCDKDDEEQGSEEGCSKDEDESEDEFFVPDGYLSENEGVQVDRMEIDPSNEEAKGSLGCKGDLESEEFYKLLQQQKFLNNLTENALKKNQPLFISNFMHEKLEAENLTGTSKLEKTCLEVISMRAFPGLPHLDTSAVETKPEEEDACFSKGKADTSQASSVVSIPESDMRIIIATIQSCSQSISKVVEALQQKFPTVSKTQLRSIVREISSFADNHWQVKKEILDRVGIRISPVKSGGRMQSISAFFSKRCLPPAAKSIDQMEANSSHGASAEKMES